MLRFVSRIAVIGLGLGGIACTTLPDIQPSTCGNLILEPGEDCDGFLSADDKGRGVACGAAGSTRACRFDCTKHTRDINACPAGFVCGADAICRTPSGDFSRLASFPAAASRVLMGDFDADGRSDLVTLDDDTGQLGVFFIERDGVVAQSYSSPSDGAFPGIGRFDSTLPNNDDLAFAVSTGLGVVLGAADRAFAPKAYASISLPLGWGDTYMVAVDAIPSPPIDPMAPMGAGARWAGDEILLIHDGLAYSTDANVDITKPNMWALKLPIKGPWAVGEIQLGNLDEDPFNSPCKELVLPDTSTSFVHIVTPCLRASDGKIYWNNTTKPDMAGNNQGGDLQTTYLPVALPGGVKVQRVLLAQLNPTLGSMSQTGRDQHLDLLITGDDHQLYAAYGLGNGRFRNAVPMPGDPPTDSAALFAGPPEPKDPPPPMKPLERTEMLAAADLNGDGVPDFVRSDALLVSVSGTNTWGVAGFPARAGERWTSAVLVDFNGDGRVDVVASSEKNLGIQLFTNAGAAWNPELIATDDPVSQLQVGDFDGDLQSDVAFRQGRLTGRAKVGVLYGRQGEPPAAPRLYGELDDFSELVTGVDLAPRVPANQLYDLAVVTHGQSGDAAAAFFGRADRTLAAPFLFRIPNLPPIGDRQVHSIAVGQFEKTSSPFELAVIFTDRVYSGPTAQQEAYLWLLSPSGNANLASVPDWSMKDPHKDPKAKSLQVPLDWSSAVLVPMHISDVVAQDLVVLAPTTDLVPKGAVLVASSSASGFDLGVPITLDQDLFVNRYGPPAAPGALRRNAQPCVADINGDGKEDLVALTVDAKTGTRTRVTILWGTGDKNAPFDVARIDHVTLPDAVEDGYVTGFTCIQADKDAAMEIVLVTDGAAIDGKKTGGRTYLVNADLKRSLVVTAVVDPREPGLYLPGGASVTTGNIDDDRIPDLIIGNRNSATIFLGKATNP